MLAWNVVITVHEGGCKRAMEVFEEFGRVDRTEFFNVLAAKITEVPVMLDVLNEKLLKDEHYLDFLSKLVPLTETFLFETREEFEDQAESIAMLWSPQLANKSFHVRVHRRGLKDILSGLDEEHFLDDSLLDMLEREDTPGLISFDNPDAVIVIETIGQWAGMGLWTREDFERYPYLRIE